MSQPLLSFETLAPSHPTIRIDQVEYELALLNDFGIRAQARFGRLLREAAELEAELAAAPPVVPTGNSVTDAALQRLGPVTEELADKVAAYIDEVVASILDAPPEVRARLSELQKRQIIESFMPAALKAATAPQTARRQSPSTSARSARSSRPRTTPTRVG